MNLKILIISTALLIGSLNTSFAQVQPNTNSAYLINEQTDYKISTSGSNVNLRSGPGTNYSIIAKITAYRVVFRKDGHIMSSKLGYFYKGNTVEILEEANKHDYYKVRVINTNGDYKNNIGYVHKNYVKI